MLKYLPLLFLGACASFEEDIRTYEYRVDEVIVCKIGFVVKNKRFIDIKAGEGYEWIIDPEVGATCMKKTEKEAK